jgi:uncharacterized protein (DUF924 family)
LHEAIVARSEQDLLADARTALAAVIVLDQFSRNMFRDTPRVFAADPQALAVAQAAIERGFEAGLNKDERMFLYLPFEHSEDRAMQARSLALMATLGDGELSKWQKLTGRSSTASVAFRIATGCWGAFRRRRRWSS